MRSRAGNALSSRPTKEPTRRSMRPSPTSRPLYKTGTTAGARRAQHVHAARDRAPSRTRSPRRRARGGDAPGWLRPPRWLLAGRPDLPALAYCFLGACLGGLCALAAPLSHRPRRGACCVERHRLGRCQHGRRPNGPRTSRSGDLVHPVSPPEYLRIDVAYRMQTHRRADAPRARAQPAE
jgi:hypothetical protein